MLAQNNNAKELAAEGTWIIYRTIAFDNFRIPHIQENVNTGSPGASVFYTNPAGSIVHTYSTFARGLNILAGTYNFPDLAPKGRDEDGLAFTMAWVRHHHDRYDEGYFFDPKAKYTLPKGSGSCCAGEHTPNRSSLL